MTRLRETYLKDEVHDRWEAVYRGNPAQDRFNDRIMDHLLRFLNPPPNALFLDAGCGIGDHSLRIARRGYRCIGVDLSEKILTRARIKVAEVGLAPRVSVLCQALEDLSFPADTFDAIHCRGVLMHIPAWEKALEELIRVLKPGGKIAIFELNDRSVESRLVRCMRHFRASESKLTRTEAGLEFWSEEGGEPLLARVADIRRLVLQLDQCGVDQHARWSSEFWDINRFPAGVLRRIAIGFNLLWFSFRLPPGPSSGNLIVGAKRGRQSRS